MATCAGAGAICSARAVEVVLYDLTSTYFECDVPTDENDPRRFGYSRDKRSDCVQVVVALVVTPEGLPLAYEMFPGNTADKTTLARDARDDPPPLRRRRADLDHGSRDPHRGNPRRVARGRLSGALLGWHAQGSAHPLRGGARRATLADGAPAPARQTAAAGRRTLRARREPSPREQGARHPPPPVANLLETSRRTATAAPAPRACC